MKARNAQLIAFVWFGFLVSIVPAHAFGPARLKPAPMVPAIEGSKDPIVISPDTLKGILFRRDLNIRDSVIQKWKAKADLYVARAKLFPSVDVTSIMSPNPVFSSARFFLPFFLPSNWFNKFSAEELLEFDTIGLRLVELNEFASAYSLYFTILSDLQNKAELEKQAADLKKIADALAADDRHFGPGMVPVEDLAKARDQAAFAEIAASEARVVCANEKEQLRNYLYLPLKQEFTFAPAELAPSIWETVDSGKVLTEAHRLAPEVKQLEALDRSRGHSLKSIMFSWLTGASVLAAPKPGHENVGFGNLSASATGTIGPVTYYEYKRGQLDLDSVINQQEQFLNSETHGVAMIFDALKEAVIQADQAKIAEVNAKIAYETIYKEYQDGGQDLQTLMLSHKDLATAVSMRLEKDLKMTLIRITLHRAMLTDQFATITGIEAEQAAAGEKDAAREKKAASEKSSGDSGAGERMKPFSQQKGAERLNSMHSNEPSR